MTTPYLQIAPQRYTVAWNNALQATRTVTTPAGHPPVAGFKYSIGSVHQLLSWPQPHLKDRKDEPIPRLVYVHVQSVCNTFVVVIATLLVNEINVRCLTETVVEKLHLIDHFVDHIFVAGFFETGQLGLRRNGGSDEEQSESEKNDAHSDLLGLSV